MEIKLTPQLEELIQRKVDTGRYASASEVVREALRVWEDHLAPPDADLDQLRAAIDAGARQADVGDCRPLDVEKIKTEGRRQLAARKQSGAA